MACMEEAEGMDFHANELHCSRGFVSCIFLIPYFWLYQDFPLNLSHPIDPCRAPVYR